MSNNNIKIIYNNKDVFSGIAPTPFVSISNDYIDFGTKWNQVTNITLEGQLTGKYLGALSYNFLNDAVRQLHNNFSENYKTLIIQENGIPLYSGDIAIINSINIEESNWYGLLPFSVELSVYNSNLFQDYYGIVEPSENFSFNEEENDILSLTHSVSAKGFNTKNKNAIQNAKEWVLSKTGNISNITPFIIKNFAAVSSRPYLLYSTQEIVDRFNGTYTWEAVYKKSLSLENPNFSILNYTIDLNSGIDDGMLTVGINGNLEGNSLQILRNEYTGLNLYNLCNLISRQTFSEILSQRPISQSVEEISGENKLNFSASFNNDFLNEIVNNYTVDINEDVLKCIRNVNLNANISCKYGDIQTKWEKVKDFYNTKFFPSNIINQEIQKEFPNVKLNPSPTSESITFDEFNAQISYSAGYTDKFISSNEDILNLTSSVNYKPSIFIHVANSSAFTPREHNVQNIKCANRSSIDISVTATAKINKNISVAFSEAGKECNRIKNNYIVGTPVLENRVISKNNDIKTVTIQETWTFEGIVIS